MLGLRTHIVRSKDIETVAQWYEKVFETKRYFQNESYIGLEVAGFEFGVFKIFPGEEITIWENVNMYWWVDNIEQEFKRLVWLWVVAKTDIMDVGEGVKMADLIDPFGNFFGIIYNPNFNL